MSLVAFLTALSNYSVQPFLPVMADDLGASIPAIGQAAMIPLLVAAFIGLAIGPLAETLGYKRVAISGLALIALSALGVALAPTLEILLAARVLAGVGAGATLGIALTYVGAVHRHPARQRAISYVAAASSISAVIGIPTLTTLEAFAGWRGAMLAVGAVAIVLLLVLVIELREPQGSATEPWQGISTTLRSYLPLVGDRRMIPVLAGLLCAGMGNIGTVTYLSAYFTDHYAATTGNIGLILALVGGSYTLGSFIGGLSFMDIRSRLTYLLLGLGAGLPTWALLALQPQLSLALVTVCIALVATGALSLMLMTTLSYEGATGAARTMAVTASITNLGAATGVAAGGLLLGLGGYDALGLFGGLAFIVAGAIAALRGFVAPEQDRLSPAGFDV